MSRAIKTSAFATSPAPSIGAIFLRLVPTILARGGSATAGSGTGYASTVLKQIPRASIVAVVVEKILMLLLHVVPLVRLWRLWLLPKLNSPATCPIAEDVVGFQTRRGCEEGDDADADAECSGRVEGIRHHGVVRRRYLLVVVVVEGRSWRHHEHAHLRVID